MFLAWPGNLLDESGIRDKKTFAYAVHALEKFLPHLRLLLSKYEIVRIGPEEKPAIELGFKISLLSGFSYRGYVDVVLRNKESGEMIVVELKTTKSSKLHEAMYKHSGQALGYSLILDAIAKDLNVRAAYKVIYYVYKSTAMEWEVMPFDKSYLQRALWIKQLLMDQARIEYYAQEGIFPMHGENCFDFFRPCPYFGICEMSDTHLLPKEIPVQVEEEYDFEFDIHTLIESQLEAHTS